MESFAIHSAGKPACIGKSHHRSCNQVSISTISNCTMKSRWPHKLYASPMAVATTSIPFDKILSEEIESPSVSEKLDEWMGDSVGDIVKNLNQAPLLVQIYANNNGVSTEIKTERAVAANWPNVMRKKPSPDGIILVEELGENLGIESESGDGTKAWGVVIQGKGECGSACYLLKTTRVGCGGGLGSFCTHFCLVKVKSFRDSALQQFTDSWLLP